MRIDSVNSMKHKGGRVLQKIPAKGTRLRQIYDLFQASQGLPVKLSLSKNDVKGTFSQLINFYGMDIRHIAKHEWVLAGEWIGRVYIDYIAERLAEKEN